MSVWELYTQLFARNWRCGIFARSLSQGCSQKIRKKDVVMTAGRWSSWSIQIPQFLMLWWSAMKAGSTAMIHRPRDRVPSGSMLALPDPRRPYQANPPTNVWWSLFLTALAGSTCTGFPLERQSTSNSMLWFYGSSERESVGRGQHSSNRVSGISTRTMHQSTTPSLSQTIWPRWALRQFLSVPIVQTLLPVTFSYSLSSRKNLEAVVMRQLRRWKRLWRRSLTRSHKRTPWDLPEVVETVQVHCSRRRLLRKGLEFHMCTINKSAHRKKVWQLISWTLFIPVWHCHYF